MVVVDVCRRLGGWVTVDGYAWPPLVIFGGVTGRGWGVILLLFFFWTFWWLLVSAGLDGALQSDRWLP